MLSFVPTYSACSSCSTCSDVRAQHAKRHPLELHSPMATQEKLKYEVAHEAVQLLRLLAPKELPELCTRRHGGREIWGIPRCAAHRLPPEKSLEKGSFRRL